MKPQLIYAQTARGKQEMHGETHTLDARHRRFLGLLDGRRSIAELKTVARPSEIDATLGLLLEQGYIEKVGEVEASRSSFATDEQEQALPDPFAEAAMTPEMFVQIRRRALRDLRQRAGATADPVVTQIENCIDACETPAALRIALREAEALLAKAIGDVAAREFLQSVGRNLVA